MRTLLLHLQVWVGLVLDEGLVGFIRGMGTAHQTEGGAGVCGKKGCSVSREEQDGRWPGKTGQCTRSASWPIAAMLHHVEDAL